MIDTAIIKVINLTKVFKVGLNDVTVLRSISFELNKGDFCIIIGPSGSGKSTLLHSILGLEIPSSGNVVILDKDIYFNTTEDDRSEFRKMHIGMVYQQPNWVKSLSVLENICFPLNLAGVPKIEALQTAIKALNAIGMRSWAGYKPTELSGGQQQKCAVARALVTNPEILVADEPTGNLDYESGQSLMELFSELNSQGKTVIMVTHDLEYLKFGNCAVRVLDGKVEKIYRGEEKEQIALAIKTKKLI